ncbi:DnaJ domain-containing protein [Pseudonocardia hierapolitana]|uniref:DnaJ domain-containing protein n=1 Tax=Pseudonocardia hierapolitana TaxID=1128676 RepID=UPI0011BECC40
MDCTREARVNLYQLLGVDASADGTELARAYRRRLRQLHPDVRHPTATDPDQPDPPPDLAAIQQAYQVLRDPARRALRRRPPGPRRASAGGHAGTGRRPTAPQGTGGAPDPGGTGARRSAPTPPERRQHSVDLHRQLPSYLLLQGRKPVVTIGDIGVIRITRGVPPRC